MHIMRNMEQNKEAWCFGKSVSCNEKQWSRYIAIGIILLVTGVTVGIISIINGASLLKHKNNITF